MRIDEKAQSIMKDEWARKIPALRSFLDRREAEELLCFAFRNDQETEQEAVTKAWKNLATIIDGVSLVADSSTLPEICPVVQIREVGKADGRLKLYASTGWGVFHNPGTDLTAWKQRNHELFIQLLKLFKVAMTDDQKIKNDLGYQLQYSIRMYRAGIESGNFGIEFLCKFSALEGLVCGYETKNKGDILKKRIGLLFPKNQKIPAAVERLWKLRCEASHQAKAFYNDERPDTKVFHSEVVDVEYIFAGVLCFALDHIETAKSVKELWTKVSSYKLPASIVNGRPQGMGKIGFQSVISDIPIKSLGIGAVLDNEFAALKQPVTSPPSP